MAALQIVLGACLAFSTVYHLLAAACAHRWRGSHNPQRPNELPNLDGPTTLRPITILKPVRGADPEQRASFSTFCLQDYPNYQIIFGALDPGDPALETARRVMADHPDTDVTIVDGGQAFGLNRKVCNLTAMLPHAKHDLLVLSDSDMRVDEGYLRRVAAPFSDSDVGLVTCLYRGFAPRGTAARLEALGIGADFIPSVLVAYYVWGVRPAFGSTIGVTRQTLAELGGFESLANELADDYKLAEAVNRLGRRVVLSDYVVDDVLGSESLSVMWSRRLRWAKTSRLMQPGPYAGAFITYTLPIGLLFTAVTGFTNAGWGALAGAYAIRCAAAVWIGTASTRDLSAARHFLLLPISDIVSFALWVGSFFGSSIVWRGERFRVARGGQLIAVSSPPLDAQAPNSTNHP